MTRATYSQAGTLHVLRVGIGTSIFPDLNERHQALCGTWLEGPYLESEQVGVEKFKRDLCDTCEAKLRDMDREDVPREVRAAWQEQERASSLASLGDADE